MAAVYVPRPSEPVFCRLSALATLALASAAAAAPPLPFGPRLRPARRQRLIDRGVVRPRSARTASFQLHGSG
jgi:hypothetical protein